MNDAQANLELAEPAKKGAKIVVATILGLVVVLCVLGWLRNGKEGGTAAAVAVVTCGGAVFAARTVEHLLADPGLAPLRIVAGMLIRMGIPLVICTVVYSHGRGPLVEAGLGYYVLPAYFMLLGLETWLSFSRPEADCVVRR